MLSMKTALHLSKMISRLGVCVCACVLVGGGVGVYGVCV